MASSVHSSRARLFYLAPWLFFIYHLQSWGFDCNLVNIIAIAPSMTLMYQASTDLHEHFMPSKLAMPERTIHCHLPSQRHIIVLWTRASVHWSQGNTSQTMLPSLYWFLLNQYAMTSLAQTFKVLSQSSKTMIRTVTPKSHSWYRFLYLLESFLVL